MKHQRDVNTIINIDKVGLLDLKEETIKPTSVADLRRTRLFLL